MGQTKLWFLAVLLSLCTWLEPGKGSHVPPDAMSGLGKLQGIAKPPPRGSLPFHMNSVIHVVEVLESHHLDGHLNLTMTELARGLGCCDSEFYQLLLGEAPAVPPDLPFLSQEQRAFLMRLVKHEVQASSTEQGVVLLPDGTTVAVSPLVAGIEAGLKGRREVPLPPEALELLLVTTEPLNQTHLELPLTIDALYAVTIAKALGVAFLLAQANESQVPMGPNGCWDSVSEPQNFTLLGRPSPLTDAFVNGALDGVILGAHLAGQGEPAAPLSTLLREYYAGDGLAGESQARSNFRRQNFVQLTEAGQLEEQVVRSLQLLRALPRMAPLLSGVGDEELLAAASRAVQEFTEAYLECPAVIPRCMWGARPYKGTPTQLKLPLSFVYIHHTSSPSQPCRTFPECAADMRAMQRFHQDDRGWDDIGYSFVVGSDGYMYQGRGWHWVGAHTRGYNSKGYGVSFIGDYMDTLPEAFALTLVRDNFLPCAVKGAKIRANYTVHGHRQMVHTACPGNLLYREIQTWQGFK
ncbi:N-acetylmuramoyl-L-alanine amidase isoform X1 [Gopherus flavomarginatus]|uniref:N-acetylmuramoyl-L-alanine amidase isoform X1 n=1 Tax=Gopherus flavomarginatus TaxID=286002 RepID=UPI0021CB9C15|nr:N-acetylmuramoyl-L-alanine amidase isoform X1 [Gopherus flavomarginatus]XP_050781867.1 N-acetylmuramoyl-L-alanine amidase isoform X1 [Gopherus flavomarginatus]XP_050781868.1 N-acetylmuramoyl-L-alanine amidase isoform X1 [Gopherus flavomarginatus]